MRRSTVPVRLILSVILVCTLVIVSLPVLDTLLYPEGSASGHSIAFAQDASCAGCDTVKDEIKLLKSRLAAPPPDATSADLARARQSLAAANKRFDRCVSNGCLEPPVIVQPPKPDSGGERDDPDDTGDIQAPDSDGDGVPDYVDDCPGTARGVVVDSRGCPKVMELYVSMPEDNDVFAPGTVNMTIEGHVQNLQGGYPIGGATIRTYLYDDGPEGVEWYLELDLTNSEGYFLGPFQLTSIPPGVYSLRVTASAQGYADVSKTVTSIAIGDIAVACYSDSDCDDGDPCTIDTCVNPGTPSAYCLHEPIVSCGDSDGCCPPGCDYTTDNDCPRPSNIEALNVLHDATENAIREAKEKIHALEDSSTPSQELEEELKEGLKRIDQGIEELNSGIKALDEHIEDQTQQLLIEELKWKNKELEMELRLEQFLYKAARQDNAELVTVIKTQEGIIKTKDAEMVAMQISISDDALLMMVDGDTECEIEELHEDSMLVRVKEGVVGSFKFAADTAWVVAGTTLSIADTALTAAGSVADSVVDAAGSVVDSVVDAAGSVAGSAVNAAGSVVDSVVDAASDMIDYINPFSLSVFSDNAGLFSTHTKFELSYDPASRITTVTAFEDFVTVTSLRTDEPERVVAAGQRIEITDDGFSPTLDLTQADLLSLADRYAIAFGGMNPLLIGTTSNPPSASFALMPQEPEAGDTVVVVSTSSDPDGDTLSTSWYVDGEHLLELENQSDWEWADVEAGKHTVTLKIDDGKGGTDEYSMAVTVARDAEDGGIDTAFIILIAIVAATAGVLFFLNSRRRRRR